MYIPAAPVFLATNALTNYAARNLKTVQSIYGLTAYPNQVPILTHGASAVPSGLFSPNAAGRVSLVGIFTGFDESTDYFFALAPVPGQAPNNGSISKATLVEFTSGCPEVASSVVYLTISKHNPDGSVAAYDAFIPNLNAWVETNVGIGISNPLFKAGSTAVLCKSIQQWCTGANAQYRNIAHCVTTMLRKPYGHYDEAWGDNVVCRSIHVVLTQVRPDVHCSHVGPDGGGKCVDNPYNKMYFEDWDLYGQDSGAAFRCDK